VVYARTTAEHTLTFQVSGRLWRNSLIMSDRETGTMWSHVTGVALEGKLIGRELERIPSVQTTWEHWKASHPNTRVLQKGNQITSSHYQRYFDDPDRVGMFRAQWLHERMPGKELVWGATVGSHAVAVTEAALAGARPVTVELGDTPVIVARGRDGGVRAFIARVGDQPVELGSIDPGGLAKDPAAASTWDLTAGRCIEGKLVGQELEAVAVTRVFWFAWSSFYPNTEVVDRLPKGPSTR